MNRIKHIISFLCLLSIVFAKPVSFEKAQAVAMKRFPAKTIDSCELISGNIYLTTFSKGGFLLSAADDAFPPVLGYDDASPVNRSNPAFRALCDQYGQQIRAAINDKNPIHPDWEMINSPAFDKTFPASDVDPLIVSTWNQSPYYNDSFPYFTLPGYTSQQPHVGCVAVVMGQLMNYYQHPVKGYGKRWFYSETTDSLLFAWYDTSYYNYAMMPDSLGTRYGSLTASPEEVRRVSNFLYECAVSVDMDFQPEGSASSYEDMMYALVSYFDYAPGMNLKLKSDYTDSEWRQLIKQELDAGYPLPYRGSGDDGGHAFLLDGYQTGTSTYFHFNWGWGGAYDGWFLLSALDPAEGYSYPDNQAAVFNIRPNADDITRFAYTGFEGYEAGWIYSGSNFYSITGESDLVYGFSVIDQWLISPKIHIPDHDNAVLMFYAMNIGTSTRQCKVMLSQSDTLRESFTVDLGTIAPGTSWSPYTYSLRSYKNTDVHIGIRYLSSAGYIVLDDLVVFSPKIVIGTEDILPETHRLLTIYPNPFNPRTTIGFRLASESKVQVNIYDLKGRLVTTLAENIYKMGEHHLEWDASASVSGIYICTLFVDHQLIESQKMILVK